MNFTLLVRAFLERSESSFVVVRLVVTQQWAENWWEELGLFRKNVFKPGFITDARLRSSAKVPSTV